MLLNVDWGESGATLVGARVRWSSTWDRAYDVPLLQSLQQMLRNESILSEIQHAWYVVGAWMYYTDTSNNRLSENRTTSV